MDQLLIEQDALATKIEKLKINFEKTPVARRTLGYVSNRLASLNTYWNSFQTNDTALHQYQNFSKSKYAIDQTFDELDEFYATLSDTLSSVLHTLAPPAPQPPAPIIAQAHPSPFRLPQISIPTFSGDYANWSAFNDMFVSLIHSNGSLTNVQKLHYLKSNLSGQAANLLRHTTITNDNYDIAWNLLKRRYQNKKALVDTQLKILYNQPGHSAESSSNIRELIDTTTECLNALRGLEVDIASWDPLLLFIIVQKLSKETHSAWELSQQDINALPEFSNFIDFLENRFRVLEVIDERKASSATASKQSRQLKNHAASTSSASSASCPICSEQHYLRACPTFLRMSIGDRRDAVKKDKICFNCLVPGHYISECKNRMKCRTCNKRHHTLLHSDDTTAPQHNSTPATQQRISQPSTPQHISTQQSSIATQQIPHVAAAVSVPVVHSVAAGHSINNHCSSNVASSSRRPKNVLLGTALIIALSRNGAQYTLRALIDPGSDASFITESAAQLLRLQPQPINDSVSGIGNTPAGNVNTEVAVQVRSDRHPDFTLCVYAAKMRTITGILPQTRRPYESWPHLFGLALADPTFFTPGNIDILLGSDVYTDIILPGQVHGPPDTPMGQETVFGWVFTGRTESSPNHQTSTLRTHHTCINIDSRLKSFWEIENVPSNESNHTEEEIQCEAHYVNTHSRTPEGKYIVRLPLRHASKLGETRTIATQRLLQVERRLKKEPKLKSAYIDFMREYVTLGHMVAADPDPTTHRYYIPHHAVFKDSSTTTKVRVVFDASCKSSTGQSLNELMLIGPKIQPDLSTILLRFRKFPIAFTGDVEKMYRQILVHQSDTHLQHILWRESPDLPIVEYALQTVTYGTSCAPHLAVRTLHQLAIDHASEFPVASHIAQNDFYVDDLMSGSYTASDAIQTRRDICEMLLKGGLKLRKWVSNYSPLLDDIPLADREIQHPLNINLNNTVTALGITWNPASDTFQFALKLPCDARPATKRNILSDISTLFDPLGWLAPAIIRTKILMQQLWLNGVDWDEPVSDHTATLWTSIRNDLFNVSKICINRWMYHAPNARVELHGFSDASTHAYAAAIYSRILQPDGHFKTSLLTAKTRVAPLKQVSIPRLELCGATLLAELLQTTQHRLQIADMHIHAWTDSSIVLHWIHAHPSKWKTFVANRVSTIQQLTPTSSWRHVPTADNPADCASRGLDMSSLHAHKLWWHGPAWLVLESHAWPVFKSAPQPDLEERRTVCLATSDSSQGNANDIINIFSSITRLLRVTAYCKRFISKCRKLPTAESTLSTQELQASLTHWILTSQREAFHTEISGLINKQPVPSKSKLIALHPFLDEQQILRVGGRLQNTELSFNEKHPIILSNNCHLATLIIRMHHLETMHGGCQLVLAMLRKKYWVLNARNAVRMQIHRCITCHRFKAQSASQLMGNLPAPRVNISRAFTHTGVDYAGPVDIRMSKGRGNSSYKGYISLFVCLCTKAIHIEAVSDLTSQAFIAAYRRFVARRGLPTNVYSDNGTNFVGAVKILRKSYESSLLKVKAEIIDHVTRENTQWHFIPPSSPHFGGLWEAGVKSLKHHLKRNIGNSKLTYEELSTLLVQIEACLNSRPLAPITTSPDDLTALTPGHFLIGDALLAAPDHTTPNENVSLLSRWHLVQRIFHNIALRWQSEYLSRLQQRPKWNKPQSNIKINDLVLIKDINSPPSCWPLARVIEIHPGSDGLVRVVTVRTSTSTFKRAVAKICPLPC